jgi:hypothetical protein
MKMLIFDFKEVDTHLQSACAFILGQNTPKLLMFSIHFSVMVLLRVCRLTTSLLISDNFADPLPAMLQAPALV